MSPRFDAAPTEVVANFEILDKGTYELTINEGKAFMRKNRKDQDSYGVRYMLVVAEGPKKGSKVMVSCYQQSEGAQSMSKQFLMAALNYNASAEDEAKFNDDFRGHDWSYDTDSGAIGEVWGELQGKRIVCDMDVKVDNSDPSAPRTQQVYKWRPLKSAK